MRLNNKLYKKNVKENVIQINFCNFAFWIYICALYGIWRHHRTEGNG